MTSSHPLPILGLQVELLLTSTSLASTHEGWCVVNYQPQRRGAPELTQRHVLVVVVVVPVVAVYRRWQAIVRHRLTARIIVCVG